MGSGVKVWASGPLSPDIVCPDANVPVEPNTTPGQDQYPSGSATGQYGWDVGLAFSSLPELADLLTKVVQKSGQHIERLAISVHGAPGYLDIDGKLGLAGLSKDPKVSGAEANEQLKTKTLGPETFDSYAGRLKAIAPHLIPGATLLFMSCNTGAGAGGNILLKRLSQVFPGIKIVAFIRIGVAPGFITAKHCMYPGMKVPDRTIESWSPEEAYRRQIAVRGEPWASEQSPMAKVAFNGAIIKNPEGMTPQAGLAGRWAAETGDVHFIIVFEVAGNATTNVNSPGTPSTQGWIYWADNVAAPRHYGRWKLAGDRLSWEFDDDPPGWKRTWNTQLDLTDGEFRSFVIKGDVTIGGVNHGYFTLTKSS